MEITLKLNQSDLDPIVNAALEASSSFESKGGYPRFIVLCDGRRGRDIKTKKHLIKELGLIKSGSTCWVWRNYSNGATISFDGPPSNRPL